ncbi:hypothetical protein MKX03_012029 [Papaver bracteatum]|nr:hypothetical protein MKX03_012029 [Papaver bracteatum]
MAGGGGEGDADSLEYTPTWIVALVCSIIVFISLAVERLLHSIGKHLKRKNQRPLFEALLKIKEELMLLGFISLLLTVFQTTVSKICIRESWTKHLLPCDKPELKKVAHIGRKILASGGTNEYCTKKGKVPLLSLEALHQLHIFIFVLAIVHITFCVLTILFSGMKIRTWKRWEDSIAKDKYDSIKHLNKVTHVQQNAFVKDHFLICGRDSAVLRWLVSFFKQFYVSVTKLDYITLRLGFITTHCKGNPKFDFHKYMVRALEADFKKVVGISWYLWVFVVVFLLLNVKGWNTYFWIAFVPLFLLLAVGAKLQHVITQLAHEVAEKHIAVEGDLVVKPSDEHFWFNRPRIILFLIHFILFQNAFEIAFFFWIWVEFGFNSCIMGQVRYIIPRLVIGVFIQVLCSYSTLPLYAIVAQMGSSFNKAIFDEHVQVGLVGWAEKARKRGSRSDAADGSPQSNSSTAHILMGRMGQQQEATKEDGDIALISPTTRRGEP